MNQLAVGQYAPTFTLTDAHGATVALEDYSGQQVIVYFYPKAATPGCTTEACDFRDNINSLAAEAIRSLVFHLINQRPSKLSRNTRVSISRCYPTLGQTWRKPMAAMGKKLSMAAPLKGRCAQHLCSIRNTRFSTPSTTLRQPGMLPGCETRWLFSQGSQHKLRA